MAQEDLIKQFNQLPENIQDLLMSEEIADLIAEEEQLNYLPAQKGQMIASLVADVLLGNLSYKEFTPTLIDKLGVNPIISKNIAQKIESKIFFPVKEDLDKIYRRTSFMKKSAGMSSEAEPSAAKPEQEIQDIVRTPEAAKNEEAKEPIAPIITPQTTEPPVEAAPIINKPMPEVNQPAEVVQTTSEVKTEAPKRSFSSFFRFKKPSQLETKDSPSSEESSLEGQVIIGKEKEFKPVLEEKSPWMISFEEVKPLKEKVISQVEINPQEESSKAEKKFEEQNPSQEAEKQLTEKVPESVGENLDTLQSNNNQPIQSAEENPSLKPKAVDEDQLAQPAPIENTEISSSQSSPVKIVNYSEKESVPQMDSEKEKLEMPTPETVPFLSSQENQKESSFEEQSKKEEPSNAKSPISPQPTELQQPEIPSENVIDLRKLKF